MAGQQFARRNYDDETTAEWMARRQRIVDERNGVRRAAPAQAARPADGLTELRREQEAFRKVVHAESQKNSWMAIPALAPAAVILAAEGAGALALRPLVREARKIPHRFVERDPFLRVGDNWATRFGRAQHAALRDRLAQKPGWDYEQRAPTPNGGFLKPDASAPSRNPALPNRRYQMELKPDTPSGRVAAARAVRKYEELTGNKTRAIYYKRKD